jgi:hypothetical protein
MRQADAWIAMAIDSFDAASPGENFLRTQLQELRLRIAELPNQPATPAADTTGIAERRAAKAAIEEAVQALRTVPGRLNARETIILTRLIVIQSSLCSSRYSDLG